MLKFYFEILKNMFSLEIKNKMEILDNEIIVYLKSGKFRLNRAELFFILNESKKNIPNQKFEIGRNFNNFEFKKRFLNSKREVKNYIVNVVCDVY